MQHSPTTVTCLSTPRHALQNRLQTGPDFLRGKDITPATLSMSACYVVAGFLDSAVGKHSLFQFTSSLLAAGRRCSVMCVLSSQIASTAKEAHKLSWLLHAACLLRRQISQAWNSHSP